MARKTSQVLEKPGRMPVLSTAERQALREQSYADVWAQRLELEVDGHPFDLSGREYQLQIIRDEHPHIVMPKGAQMGMTSVMLVRTLHWITKRRWQHLYLLPLKTGSVSFVQGRIDPIIESSKELDTEFSNVDSRVHKQTARGVNWYIRGTNIWTELREVPVDVLILDERDKMVEENIPEAKARLDGSSVKRTVELSTPTVPGHGVDSPELWGDSDQHRWYVPCPHCGRFQTMTFVENVVVGSMAQECYTICSYCKKTISDQQRWSLNALGRWEPENPGGRKRGYFINQLNSPTQTIEKFMENYFEGQRDGKKLRAFYNNNQGIPWVAAGEQFTAELLDSCRGDYQMGGIPPGPLFIGVDVGTHLHVKASYVRGSQRVAWAMMIFSDDSRKDMWTKLDEWLGSLGTFMCVIDAQPEKSKASDLAKKYHKRVWVGFENDRPQQVETAVFNNPAPGETGKVSIDRTAAFDTVIGSYINGNTVLPRDAREVGELMPKLPFNGFYHHMIQMVRKEEANPQEQIVARWVKNKNPDHWHHTDMFEMVATMKEPYVSIPVGLGEMMQQAGAFVAA